jgi:hypothetical protein
MTHSALERTYVGDTPNLDYLIQDQGTAIDVSAQTTLNANYFAPDSGGTNFTRAMTFTPIPDGLGTGVDGLARASIVTADFDAAGTWTVQIHFVATGLNFHTHPYKFRVYDIES